MSLPFTEQLMFTHLRALARSGNVACRYAGESTYVLITIYTNKLIEEGFLVKDHVVSWSTAIFGIAKECRDLAYEYWKTVCYTIAEEEARNGNYSCSTPNNLLNEGSKYFQDDGFAIIPAKNGTIIGLSWEKAKIGRALNFRRLADAKYCEPCNEEKIVIARKIHERKGIFLVYKAGKVVGKREKGKTVPLTEEERLKYR